MKTFVIFALLHTAILSYAAPCPSRVDARQGFKASITFLGAGPGPPFYFQQFPTDDTVHPINNTLSVSKISSPGGAACTFFGIDGSNTFIFGEETVDVGPPQAQVSGICDGA